MQVHKSSLWSSKYFLLLLFFCVSSSACVDLEQSIEDKEKIKEAMEAHEIKRITEKQLLAWIENQGNTITRQTQKQLNRQYNAAKQAGELGEASEFYKLKSAPIIDSLEEAYQAKIKKIGFQAKPSSIQLEAEKELLKKYQQNQLPLAGRAQSLPEEDQILYTSPIILEGQPQGIWSIVFSRKAAVRMIDPEEL